MQSHEYYTSDSCTGGEYIDKSILSPEQFAAFYQIQAESCRSLTARGYDNVTTIGGGEVLADEVSQNLKHRAHEYTAALAKAATDHKKEIGIAASALTLSTIGVLFAAKRIHPRKKS